MSTNKCLGVDVNTPRDDVRIVDLLREYFLQRVITYSTVRITKHSGEQSVMV
jgi:hypothetical protein